MHLNKLNGVLPDSRLMFTGFHKLMVGGYEYDYAGHSFVQVEFRYIIEHMTGCDL